MTKANTSAIAKLSAAFIAVAMLLTIAAPAKAATIEELQAMIAQLTQQLAALSGGSSTTSSAAYTFTRSLTVGAQGADVTALQNYLIGAGHSISAGATGYFGAQTAAAVAKWQAANGISPAVGYFGSVSQAKYNSLVAAAPTTTTTTTTTTGELSGGAASLTMTNESADTETTVTAGNSKNVEGFRLAASGGDTKVTNIKLRVQTNTTPTSGASSYLSHYADSFAIYAGGEKIAQVDAADFTRDLSGDYSANVAVSQMIKKGDSNKVTFYIAMKAPSTLDSADTTGVVATVSVTSIRYTDSTGAILSLSGSDVSTASTAGISVSKTDSAEKQSISAASDNMSAGVAVVNETTTTEVDLLKFNVKATGADMKYDTILVTVSGTGTSTSYVTDWYLYRGSTRVEDMVASNALGNTVTFSFADQRSLAKGDTDAYRVVAKVKRGDTSGLLGKTITASFSSVNLENSAGNTVSTVDGSATGNTQTLMFKGVASSDFSASSVATSDTNGKITKQTFTISFKLKAFGATMYVGKGITTTGSAITATTTGADFASSFAASTTLSTASELTSTANTVNSMFEIPSGETRTFTAEVTVGSGTLSATNYGQISLVSVAGATSSSATVIATTPSPAQDFKSASKAVY